LRLFSFFLIAPLLEAASIRLSEIMYHSPAGESGDYLELVVTKGGDLTGFSITGGVDFVFPEGTVAPDGQYILLCRDPEVLRDRGVRGVTLFAYSGRLSDNGETLLLLDPSGEVVEQCPFDDDPPWPFLADGFGLSLARRCLRSPAEDAVSWSSQSPTPGLLNEEIVCPPPARPPPEVLINEVMYHPKGGSVDERLYEFVELVNRSNTYIPLAGWRLTGSVSFEFPQGIVIGPGGFLVVASDPARLREAYTDPPTPFLGPFQGKLPNGGGKVALIDESGNEIDSVSYDDDEPWPPAADGHGSIPGRGSSLERLCLEKPAGRVDNWEASPPDQATPGRENSKKTCALRPVALSVARVPEKVGPDQPVRVQVDLCCGSEDPGELVVAFWWSRQFAQPETIARMPLEPQGRLYQASIPGFPAGTIVRWRIERRAGEGWTVLAPRSTDPRFLNWYGYFVPPRNTSLLPIYHIFMRPEDWTLLNRFAARGRTEGYEVLPDWNKTVPALFAEESKLYEVKVRYQGSPWHRTDGFDITEKFSCPGPASAAGEDRLRILSLRIAFPRYDRFKGKEVVILNKVHETQSEKLFYHGLQTVFGYKLFALAGVPAPNARYVHVRINGCSYHLAVQVERPDEDFLKRFFQGEGDLFKASGCPRGAPWADCGGPYDWADGRPLEAKGPWSKEEVYAFSYDRKTRRFADHTNLIELIEELAQAARQGTDALREVLAERFDLKEVLVWLATANWGCSWDDIWQNYYLYQDLGDLKWRILPWDMDQMFGGPCCCARVDPRSSLWRGRSGDPDNWNPGLKIAPYNRFKDYFLKAFPDEYFFQLVALNNEKFKEEVLLEWVTELESLLLLEAPLDPLPISSAVPVYAGTLGDFIIARREFVNSQVIPRVDPGPDMRVEAGWKVVLNGTGSDPPPGPDVVYSWSNGAVGDRPACVFEEPGTYLLTLTIEKTLHLHGLSTKASRSAASLVRVFASRRCAFESVNGAVAFEAEDMQAHLPGVRGYEGSSWLVKNNPEASGGFEIEAHGPGQTHEPSYYLTAPELNYWVLPDRTGPHRLFLRIRSGPNPGENRLYLGFNNEAPPTWQPLIAEGTQYRWVFVDLEVPSINPVLICLWFGDPGVAVDKLLWTAAGSVRLEELQLGPEAREATCLARFVRGDGSGDGRLDIADAMAILRSIFLAGETLWCPDAGDANDDGVINIGDPIYLLQYLFIQGPAPPPPFPDPGPDPTENDNLRCLEL